MPSLSARRSRYNFLLAGPHLIWLVTFVILPLCAIFTLSLLRPDGATTYATQISLDNYLRLLQAPYPAVFLYSLLIAAVTTLICLLLSFPLALAIAFAPARWRLHLLLILCLPFWVSTLVRMYALQEILGREGIINKVIIALSEGLHAIMPFIPVAQPLELIYNRTSVLIGLVYAFIPFAVLPIYANLVRIDRKMLEASRDLGASAFATIWRIILPLSAHGLAAAAMLVFIPALGAFYVIDMLGGTKDLLIGNLVQLQFNDANDWPFGAALSIALLVCALLALYAVAWRRRRFYG